MYLEHKLKDIQTFEKQGNGIDYLGLFKIYY